MSWLYEGIWQFVLEIIHILKACCKFWELNFWSLGFLDISNFRTFIKAPVLFYW